MSSQRSRFACASCTRRKVKCSKTVPCSNCIKRGQEVTCISDAANIASPGSSAPVQREVDSLRSRILELEADLRTRVPSVEVHHSTLDNPVDHSESPASTRHDPSPAPEGTDPVMEDAASILEFLAWGRRKNPDYPSVLSPEASIDIAAPADNVTDARWEVPFENASQITTLQLLLPSRKQVYELVSYHAESLLWFHCSYYAPTFRSQVEMFYTRFHGAVNSPGINLQWLALLFAVISGSITCAPDDRTQAWGFRAPERETLSRKWHRAVYTCLNENVAAHSIFAVQAISTLTMSAHLLGYSNDHSIQLAAATRIAQGLGLHRITDEASGTVADKECGRRLWSQLCCQDWFGIPFSDTYLINPLYSQSGQPLNCHDEDIKEQPADIPTIATYTRLLYRVASIMPQLQDDIMSCNTPFTKYELVIKWDKRMRALSTSERPQYLLSQAQVDPSWPCYVPWERRSLAITSSHKIIMIHRSFLSESFTNPVFSFTRRTCLAASKTIIKESKLATREGGPILWTHQAFPVAAAIILVLDLLHRSPSEHEYNEHRALIEETVDLLVQCQNSTIASRGVKLLSALLDEIPPPAQALAARKRRHDGTSVHANQDTSSSMRRRGFSVSAFVKLFGNSKGHYGTSASSNGDSQNQVPSSTDMELPPTVFSSRPPANDFLLTDSGLDGSYFPPGFEGTTPFENLLYLASHDFS